MTSDEMTDNDLGRLPEPPTSSFASDNAAGVSPEVMEALAAANSGPALAYGSDIWTEKAEAALRDLFDAPVESLMCWGGTGANVVGIASVIQSWQAVIAAETSHIFVDECGALSRLTGAGIIPVPPVDGKLAPESIDPYLSWLGVEHHSQPKVVSITQATEMGTVYSADEIGALCDHAHRNGMLVHLDGARIANAVVATGTDLRAMIRDTGVDLMTFGLTKDGAMYGETIVFVDPTLAERAKFVRKQAAQLASKNRFIAAQLLALLEDDLWLRNAEVANDRAVDLANAVSGIDGVSLWSEPVVNSVFASVPAEAVKPLQDWSFFWEWDPAASMVRWMTSFATTKEDVDAFAAGVRAIVDGVTRAAP